MIFFIQLAGNSIADLRLRGVPDQCARLRVRPRPGRRGASGTAFIIPGILIVMNAYGVSAVFIAIAVSVIAAAIAVTTVGPELRGKALDAVAAPTG